MLRPSRSARCSALGGTQACVSSAYLGAGDWATEPTLVAQSQRNPPETNGIVRQAPLRSSLQVAIFARALRVL
jgi:hypothetical protein